MSPFWVASAAETGPVTVIEMTDKVLVKDAVRFGINLGGDAYYSGAALVKDRARENFEGTSYRQCHFGPGSDSQGASTWFGSKYGDWDKILVGAKYTVLSGPSRFDGRVEGQQVGLVGNFVDHRDDGGDLLGRFAQLADGDGRSAHSFGNALHAFDGLAHYLGSLLSHLAGLLGILRRRRSGRG